MKKLLSVVIIFLLIILLGTISFKFYKKWKNEATYRHLVVEIEKETQKSQTKLKNSLNGNVTYIYSDSSKKRLSIVFKDSYFDRNYEVGINKVYLKNLNELVYVSILPGIDYKTEIDSVNVKICQNSRVVKTYRLAPKFPIIIKYYPEEYSVYEFKVLIYPKHKLLDEYNYKFILKK